MGKKKVKLEPVDLKRCQAERVVGPFVLGGRIGEHIRCMHEPIVIATEVNPAADGKIGSMSLCSIHKAEMVKQLGKSFATFKPIKKRKK